MIDFCENFYVNKPQKMIVEELTNEKHGMPVKAQQEVVGWVKFINIAAPFYANNGLYGLLHPRSAVDAEYVFAIKYR